MGMFTKFWIREMTWKFVVFSIVFYGKRSFIIFDSLATQFHTYVLMNVSERNSVRASVPLLQLTVGRSVSVPAPAGWYSGSGLELYLASTQFDPRCSYQMFGVTFLRFNPFFQANFVTTVKWATFFTVTKSCFHLIRQLKMCVCLGCSCVTVAVARQCSSCSILLYYLCPHL